MSLMMFEAEYTLWGNLKKVDGKDCFKPEYKYRQACYSMKEFLTKLEEKVVKEHNDDIIKDVKIINEGCC